VKLTGKLSRGKTSTQLGHRAVAVKATEKTSTGSLSLTLYVDTTGAALPIRVEGRRTPPAAQPALSTPRSLTGESRFT